MDPGLRGDDLPLDAGQELLALGQAQTQGAQIGKGVGLGDPHDIGAVFFALSSDADQPHDPGHVASTSAGIQARKYLFRSRAPNLAAVPCQAPAPSSPPRRKPPAPQDRAAAPRKTRAPWPAPGACGTPPGRSHRPRALEIPTSQYQALSC